MGTRYPGSNMQELNLDWVLSTVKENTEKVNTQLHDLTELEEKVDSAVYSVDHMTVEANTLQPEDDATATKSIINGHINIEFGIPKGEKGDPGQDGQDGAPATDAQVQTAVTAWLTDNIDPDSGYALDRTLTLSTAAAPADLVGTFRDTIAPKFSASVDYPKNQYVYYNDVLYRFTADHPAGAWTGTDAALSGVGNKLRQLMAADDDLKSAIIYNATLSASNWEVGGFVDATGATNTNSTRLHTAGFIPKEFTLVTPASGYDVIAYAWRNGSYLGAWQGSSFATSGVSWQSTADLTAVYKAGATDIKIAARKQNNSTMTTADGETYTFTASTIKKLQDEVEVVDMIVPVVNGLVDRTTGLMTNDAVFKRTGYIAVNSWSEYFYTGRTYSYASGACYDQDKNYISAILPDGGSGTSYDNYKLTIPPEAKYIAVCSLTSKDLQLSITSDLEGSFRTLVDEDASIENKISSIENGVFNSSGLTSVSMFSTMGVIGDSYSSGALYGVTGVTDGDYYNISWGQILGRKDGLTVTNYSKSGFDVSKWLSDATYGLPKLITDPALNVYVLVLGINGEKTIADPSADASIGTTADINKVDPTQNADTFCGHYGKMISGILSHASNAKIIPVVPLMVSAEKRTAIISIAELFDLPYIRMSDDAFYGTSFYTDNRYTSHPIGATYAGMALAFERQINDCIVNNISYFTDYEGN